MLLINEGIVPAPRMASEALELCLFLEKDTAMKSISRRTVLQRGGMLAAVLALAGVVATAATPKGVVYESGFGIANGAFERGLYAGLA